VASFDQNSGAGDPVTTIGINFFLHNSVAFDLENQRTLYTNQVVPEPSAALLAVFATGLFLILRSVHRRRRAG
jgi:hypothetical protein